MFLQVNLMKTGLGKEPPKITWKGTGNEPEITSLDLFTRKLGDFSLEISTCCLSRLESRSFRDYNRLIPVDIRF